MSFAPARIRRLTLKGFRSVRAEAVSLANPLFLVGANGAGKSNLVDALRFLSECAASPLAAVVERRGGLPALLYRRPVELLAPAGVLQETARGSYGVDDQNVGSFGLRIDFALESGGTGLSGGYAFEAGQSQGAELSVWREQCRVVSPEGVDFWFDRTAGAWCSNAPGVQPVLSRAGLALPVVGGTRAFEPVALLLAHLQVLSVQPQLMRARRTATASGRLSGDAGNTAQVLLDLARRDPAALARLSEWLGTVTPGLEQVEPVRRRQGLEEELTLEFTQRWESAGQRRETRFEPPQMSDGTLRALALLAALWQEPVPALVAVEEPEATMHPEALGTVLDIIRGLAQKTQVVVTTHSPELLEAKWLEPAHIRVVEWKHGATRVEPLGRASTEALQGHLMGAGEQFRSNALRPEEPVPRGADGPEEPRLFEAWRHDSADC